MNKIQSFDLKQKVNKRFNPSNYITLYTDASFDSNHHITGAAFYIRWLQNAHWGTSSSVATIKKPHLAELFAINCGIEWIEKNIQTKGRTLVVSSDCLNAMRILDTVHIKRSMGLYGITLKHTKGHTDIQHPRTWVNNKLDLMAKEVMYSIRNKINKKGNRTGTSIPFSPQ